MNTISSDTSATNITQDDTKKTPTSSTYLCAADVHNLFTVAINRPLLCSEENEKFFEDLTKMGKPSITKLGILNIAQEAEFHRQ